jgi:hypothetical protein
MKCGFCQIEIVESGGYIVTEVHTNRSASRAGSMARVPYCTFYCAAMSLDIVCLNTLQKTPMVTQLPQCRNWIDEHNPDSVTNTLGLV